MNCYCVSAKLIDVPLTALHFIHDDADADAAGHRTPDAPLGLRKRVEPTTSRVLQSQLLRRVIRLDLFASIILSVCVSTQLQDYAACLGSFRLPPSSYVFNVSVFTPSLWTLSLCTSSIKSFTLSMCSLYKCVHCIYVFMVSMYSLYLFVISI